MIKEAPVFSDKEGKHRLGTLKADQTVRLEAITDKIYRVRGQGTRDGIAGWVAPWAFSSKDPQFVAHLKELYERQIQVQALIEAKQVAVGMTLDEVSLSRGKPTKTSCPQDRQRANPAAGNSSTTRKSNTTSPASIRSPARFTASFPTSRRWRKSRTAVEFENNVVTAVEESEDHQGGNVRIVVPPLIFGW